LFRVVVSEAVGAPDAAFADFVAPMAPDPFEPVVSTPEKLITIMDASMLCERFAVTDAALMGDDAKARHISDVPL
jgi:hypothetical protein